MTIQSFPKNIAEIDSYLNCRALEYSQQELNQQDFTEQEVVEEYNYQIKPQKGQKSRKCGKGRSFKHSMRKIGRTHSPKLIKKERAAKKSLRNKAVKDMSKENRKEMDGIVYDRFWEVAFLNAMAEQKQHDISNTKYFHNILMEELMEVSDKLNGARSKQTDILVRQYMIDTMEEYNRMTGLLLKQVGKNAMQYINQLVEEQEKIGSNYTGGYLHVL